MSFIFPMRLTIGKLFVTQPAAKCEIQTFCPVLVFLQGQTTYPGLPSMKEPEAVSLSFSSH